MAVGDIVPLDNGGQLALGVLSQLQQKESQDRGVLAQMASVNAQREGNAMDAQLKMAALNQAQQQNQAQQMQASGAMQLQARAQNQDVGIRNQYLDMQRAQINQSQAEKAKEQDIRNQMTQAFMSGDMNKYESLAAANMPDVYAKLQTAKADVYKNMQDANGKNLDNMKKQMDMGSAIAQAILKNPQSFQNLNPILKQIDPNAPDEINHDYLMGMANIANKGSQDKISAQNARSLTLADDGMKAAKEMITMLDKNVNVYGASYLPNMMNTQDQQTLNLYNNKLMQNVGYLKTGAAITGSEEKRFSGLTIQPGDTYKTQVTKMKSYIENMMIVYKRLDPDYDPTEDLNQIDLLDTKLKEIDKNSSAKEVNKADSPGYYDDLIESAQNTGGYHVSKGVQ